LSKKISSSKVWTRGTSFPVVFKSALENITVLKISNVATYRITAGTAQHPLFGRRPEQAKIILLSFVRAKMEEMRAAKPNFAVLPFLVRQIRKNHMCFGMKILL